MGPNDRERGFGPPAPPFRIRRSRPDIPPLGRFKVWLIAGVVLVLAFIVLDTAKSLYVDWLWFDGVGFRSVYSKELITKLVLFFGGASVFVILFGGNVLFAARPILRSPGRGLAQAEAASLSRIYLVALIAASILLAVIYGTIASGYWDTVLRFLNSQPFGVQDPQFHRDVGFYVFKLPALKDLYGWFMGTAVLTTLAAASLHLFRYLALGDAGDNGRVRAHLCVLLVVVIGLFIFRDWYHRYDLNFSQSGVVFGATYTDIHARLPFIYVGMVMAGLTALALIISIFRPGINIPIGVTAAWVLAVIVGSIYATGVTRFSVQPNELAKERPYIQRSIDVTRGAFSLDKIDEHSFPAASSVSAREISDNQQTIGNVRLLEPPTLIQTYAQIQTIRPLYEFLDVDVDRYVIDGTLRQVMLAARELSPGRLPITAQTWVNRRLQYTHGYGAVMSPVNEVGQEGLPNLFLQNIPVVGKLPLTRPEIYYGQEPDSYVIVKTKAQEFDYPVESGNIQTTFTGNGGVKVGTIFRRWLLAWQLGDINIAISNSLTSDSRVLFRRNIAERVKEIAPFLALDRDPYLVVADGKLYWIQDAYTTTNLYPYSKPAPAGYNYIRNSVKVVVDAYDGTTTFYLVDPTDPIIETYAHIFPKLLTPLDQMPASLRAHLRYPEDLFLAQVNQYRTYHITDPSVLYNKEDLWNIPTEVVGNAQGPVQPYYVIMRIPGQSTEEFALILPLSPANRSNTIAWIAARSDGDNYGKLLSFRFPTDTLVFGPQQVESRIDQDPSISAQFTLWNQSGSRVIRGNLLMIPIGTGNIFVEPIYLQSETSQLPELQRVVVANGNSIAMEPTLAQSLNVVLGLAPPSLPGTSPSGSTGLPTPTPNSTPTVAPTRIPATPPAAGTPVSVGELARQADAAYQAAQDALKTGDFATYGTNIAKVEQLVRQIIQQTGGQ